MGDALEVSANARRSLRPILYFDTHTHTHSAHWPQGSSLPVQCDLVGAGRLSPVAPLPLSPASQSPTDEKAKRPQSPHQFPASPWNAPACCSLRVRLTQAYFTWKTQHMHPPTSPSLPVSAQDPAGGREQLLLSGKDRGCEGPRFRGLKKGELRTHPGVGGG